MGRNERMCAVQYIRSYRRLYLLVGRIKTTKRRSIFANDALIV